MSDSRRDFLLKLAKGAAYAAPVVVTLATPDGLLGQGQNTNSQKGGMGKGMPCPPGLGNQGKCAAAPSLQPRTPTPRGPSAPWDRVPPGSGPARPPTGPPGGANG